MKNNSSYKLNFISIIALMILVFISITCVGQENKECRFDVGIYFEPQHFVSTNVWSKADGFNFGGQIQYVHSLVYVKAEFYSFPDLNDLDYFSIGGAFGFNIRPDWFNDSWRLYAGGVAGAISREGWGHAYVGVETGIDYKFDNGLIIGARYSGRSRTDNNAWSNQQVDAFWSDQAGLYIGYCWKWKRN